MANIFETIDVSIRQHSAWKNLFFEHAREGLTFTDLRTVCPEYWYFTAQFPSALSKLIARVEDQNSRFHLTSILYSELGSGVLSDAHSNLFRRLCHDIGISDPALDAAPLLPSTQHLAEGLVRLYGEAQLIESLGAQYALEYQADNMLRSFRKAFVAIDDVEHGIVFFDVHEKEEPQHIQAMKKILVLHMREEAEWPSIMAGAEACLDLFGEFWKGLDKSIARP